jgi:hypothetical protein
MNEHKFSCPHCDQHLSASEEWAGQSLQCPNCQKEFRVPMLAGGDPLKLSHAPPPPSRPAGLRIAGSQASGAEPPVIQRVSDLEQQVMEGGRFVIFQYCISVLVMTFRRRSKIAFIPPGKDGFVHAFSNSMVSLVAGWWGIPWGPIWTITTVVKNARGGTDVTHAVLEEKLGSGRAAQIMANRRIVEPTGQGMKIFKWSLACVGILLLLMVAVPVFSGMLSATSSAVRNRITAPGQAAFENANNQIIANNGKVAFGNSPKAVAIAADFSTSMKLLDKSLFTGGDPNGLSITKHEYIAYCELQDSKCAVIVHVPEMRHFTAEAKDALGELAWASAQAALMKQGVSKPGMTLAVGLRGVLLYDRVMTGNVIMDKNAPNLGLIQTSTDAEPERNVFPFFREP